ncbi:MAG TPA: HIT domain-containing protein [Arachnia sp.]|nr:HIT domain-containing protein [Arachnia sp.]HMT87838.1 HIT domain-containing protein [Arachnia sp.]
MNADCLFCAIAAGTVPSKKVYEDDLAYAFLDISPLKRGHTLIIPKRHTADVFEDDATLAEIAPAIARVGRLLKDRLGAEGCNVLANAGTIAGQVVFHTHVHVVPRFADDPGMRALFTAVPQDIDEVHAALAG